MSELTISVRRLQALVTPVLPCCGTDPMLSVLNAVRIESHGQWLVAKGTDRFRLAIHRIACPDDADGIWPEWKATVPLSTIKGLLSTFKPTRGMDPELTLTIDGDGHNLRVTGAGSMFGGFSEAEMVFPLETGEYPHIDSIIADAIAAEPAPADARLNWKFAASFAAADPVGRGLYVKVTSSAKPVVVTDGDNFIGALMPRKSEGVGFPSLDSWADVLGAKSTEKKSEAAA